MKKNIFDILYVHIQDNKRVADTIEVSAKTLYEASVKFWEFARKNSIEAIKYIEYERQA